MHQPISRTNELLLEKLAKKNYNVAMLRHKTEEELKTLVEEMEKEEREMEERALAALQRKREEQLKIDSADQQFLTVKEVIGKFFLELREHNTVIYPAMVDSKKHIIDFFDRQALHTTSTQDEYKAYLSREIEKTKSEIIDNCTKMTKKKLVATKHWLDIMIATWDLFVRRYEEHELQLKKLERLK